MSGEDAAAARDAERRKAVDSCRTRDTHSRDLMGGYLCLGCGMGRAGEIKSPERLATMLGTQDGEALRDGKWTPTVLGLKTKWHEWAGPHHMNLPDDDRERLWPMYLAAVRAVVGVAESTDHAALIEVFRSGVAVIRLDYESLVSAKLDALERLAKALGVDIGGRVWASEWQQRHVLANAVIAAEARIARGD